MSTGTLVLLSLVVLGLAFGSALFSAIETSFFSLQPFHIERLKTRRAAYAARLAKLMENPRRLLAAILLSDALINLPLILLCLFLLRAELLPQIPFWVASLLIFGVVVFLCDLVPKVLALAQPARVARIGLRVMTAVLPWADPIASVLQRFSEWVSDKFVPEHLRAPASLSEEELETLIEAGAEAGTLHSTESEMIQEIIKLGDKTVRDCMVPRVDAFLVPYDLTNEELTPRLRAQRRRYVPVYGDTPDEVLGILDVRVFLSSTGFHYTELLIPPSFVPETMQALEILRSFLRHAQPLAIVVDEHGGTEGIISLMDVVEEIISDAVPLADSELYIEPLGEDRLIVDGSARLEDINELLGTNLEQEGIDTIGGLVFNRLGTLPKPGTEVQLEGAHATIRRTSRKRVEELLICRQKPKPANADDETAEIEEPGEEDSP